MQLLAIDTSTSWCSVALSLNGQVTQRHELIGTGASQHLLPWINELLKQANLSYPDLDAIAVGVGPGAFTGVRLSVAVAQGLAVGAKLPVIPVASIDAMAIHVARSKSFQAISPRPDTQFLLALDARMGEVYWARYLLSNTVPTRLGEIALSAPKDIDLSGVGYIAGNAIEEYSEYLAKPFSENQMDTQVVPSARDILQWAQPLLEAGQTIPVESLEPLYIRNKVALTTEERHAALHSTPTGRSFG